MSKQQEDIETKQQAKARSFGSMELRRAKNARPMGSRNLAALRLVEARQEEKELSDILGEF